jgi:predicted small lipoprotein YifL
MQFFSRLALLTLVIAVIVAINACGQKGPLFIPVKPPAVSTPYPVATPDVREQGREGQNEPLRDFHINDAPEAR